LVAKILEKPSPEKSKPQVLNGPEIAATCN